MIFYFTGTGNSLYVAKKIGEYNGEGLASIASIMNGNKDSVYEYTLKDDEKIGIVFPVHAWAPPILVRDFIKKLKLNNYKDNYCFAVGVCGDSAGKTIDRVRNILDNKAIKLDSGFVVIMPENYIIMFSTDSKEIENKKLQEAENTILKINSAIKEKRSECNYPSKGLKNAILTDIVNPVFCKFSFNRCRKFHVVDTCTGCGICEKVCPKGNIKLENNKPQWGNSCIQCTACLNWCPVKAVQFGRNTVKRERYTHPKISVNEMY
jgi:ferredoxin